MTKLVRALAQLMSGRSRVWQKSWAVREVVDILHYLLISCQVFWLRKIICPKSNDTYTYMESGGSLFDILNLHLGRPHKVYNPLLRSMGDTDSLKEYIDLTGEGSMKVALEIVETYEDALPAFIQLIKAARMDDSKRHLADRIFLLFIAVKEWSMMPCQYSMTLSQWEYYSKSWKTFR